MFGWFKRKPAAEAGSDGAKVEVAAANPPVTEPSIVAPEPVAPAAMPAPAAVPFQGEAASPVAAAAEDFTASEPIKFEPRTARRMVGHVVAPRSLAPGAPAFELQRGRKREAEILRTQANGRRVIARLTETGRIYAYTLRPDGTFRLEQAPTPVAAQLVRADT
ncbi:MAG: hypothetical protein RLZ98_521 [Pseudomonadota bacterium]|jgi:hypothetical protein